MAFGTNVNGIDGNGATALHVSAGMEQSKANNSIMKFLLSQGSVVDVVDSSGKTPLFIAVENTNAMAVKLLLSHGAISSWRDLSGRSVWDVARDWQGPQHRASERIEIIRELREPKSEANIITQGDDSLLMADIRLTRGLQRSQILGYLRAEFIKMPNQTPTRKVDNTGLA